MCGKIECPLVFIRKGQEEPAKKYLEENHATASIVAPKIINIFPATIACPDTLACRKVEQLATVKTVLTGIIARDTQRSMVDNLTHTGRPLLIDDIIGGLNLTDSKVIEQALEELRGMSPTSNLIFDLIEEVMDQMAELCPIAAGAENHPETFNVK